MAAAIALTTAPSSWTDASETNAAPSSNDDDA